MTSEQFAYWLQGYVEIRSSACKDVNCTFVDCVRNRPSKEEWQVIMDHLAEVFNKKTPNRSLMDQIQGAKPVPMPGFPNFQSTPNLGGAIC